MNQPGIWILGETDTAIRKSGMGIVVEYTGRTGTPELRDPSRFGFQYESFAASSPHAVPDQNEVVVPLVIKPKFEAYGDFDHWNINGLSWPNSKTAPLKEGTRYRLVLDNQSTDIHPVQLHRHSFEPTVVSIEANQRRPWAPPHNDQWSLFTRIDRTFECLTPDHDRF